MNAIPTLYNGVQFRSRLEAKWAAFFDLAGMPWIYEPLDLAGYIPDFLVECRQDAVGGKPYWGLVEVKPFTTEAPADAMAKIDRSGWKGEVEVVGLHPSFAMMRLEVGDWAEVDFTGVMFDARCSAKDFHRAMDQTWREAGNRVQWKSPR